MILFRADASSEIGSGHVFRCLGLADELRRQGHASRFACREVPGHLIGLIRDRGYACDALAPGLDAAEDARATLAPLGDARLDWLIVDHYGLGAAFERTLRTCAAHVAVIDDLADRAHACDILMDSSRFPADTHAYDALVPSECERLLGPDYVPLRREFFELVPPERDHTAVRTILVTLGGNDPIGLTGRVLDAAATLPQYAFDVTVGSSNPRLSALQDAAASVPNVTLHLQHPRPSDLMLRADLCLGAGGQTSWERCYLGLPSLLVILADNQRTLATRLDALGATRLLGDGEHLTAAQLADALRDAAADRGWRERSGRIAQSLVDGRGLERFVEALARHGGFHA